MATFTKVTAAIEDIMESGNAGSDQWAIALTNTSPASKVFTTGTTDLATGGGYTQGGTNVTTTSSAMDGANFKLVLADPSTWTATGGGFTFRYVLLVNKTVTNGANGTVVGYWDYGSSVVMNGTNGDTFTADLDQVNGVFTVG
jgi:hypothetical protein